MWIMAFTTQLAIIIVACLSMNWAIAFIFILLLAATFFTRAADVLSKEP